MVEPEIADALQRRGRRGRTRRRRRGCRGERLLHELQAFPGRNPSRERDGDAAGVVVPFVERAQVPRFEVLDGRRGAADRARQRVFAIEHAFVRDRVDVGRVVREFFEHDAAFGRDVVRIEAGMQQVVGEPLDHEPPVAAGAGQVVQRRLAAGVAVVLDAAAKQLAVARRRRSLVGREEQRVFEEVGDPGLIGVFVAGTDGDPHGDREAVGVVVGEVPDAYASLSRGGADPGVGQRRRSTDLGSTGRRQERAREPEGERADGGSVRTQQARHRRHGIRSPARGGGGAGRAVERRSVRCPALAS